MDNNRNKNNQYASVKNIINKVINIVDFTDKVFAKILIYFFGFLSFEFNLLFSISIIFNFLLNISAICTN